VSDRHHGGKIGLHDKEDAEWKAVNDGAATLLEDVGESLGPILDSPKRRAKLVEEFRTKPYAFSVVPGGRIEGVEFCLGPNAEWQHLLTGPEARLHSVDRLSPRSSVCGGLSMRRKPLLEQGLLPLLQGNLVNCGGDTIPQRLHVVDLFFHRQSVEAGRGQRQ
jgi:hypothetical protein